MMRQHVLATPGLEDQDPGIYISYDAGKAAIFLWPESDFLEYVYNPYIVLYEKHGLEGMRSLVEELVEGIKEGKIKEIDVYHSVMDEYELKKIPDFRELVDAVRKYGVKLNKKIDYDMILNVLYRALNKLNGTIDRVREAKRREEDGFELYKALVLGSDALCDAGRKLRYHSELVVKKPMEVFVEVSPEGVEVEVSR